MIVFLRLSPVQTCGNEAGKIVYDSMWRNQSGLAAFLHSPLLLELEAVNMASEEQAQCSLCEHACHRQEGHGDAEDEPVGHRRTLSDPERCLTSRSVSDLEETQKCPICLDILYKPIGLACGHKFCQNCLFKAVIPGIAFGNVQGLLNVVPVKARCPQCRQMGVFENAGCLPALAAYLKQKFPEYWRERREEERKEDSQARALILKQLEAKYGGLGISYPQLVMYG